MDGKALVDSVKKEVIDPGIQRLIDSQYFTEMRQGKLSIKRLQGWAIQHYLHNKAKIEEYLKIGKEIGDYHYQEYLKKPLGDADIP